MHEKKYRNDNGNIYINTNDIDSKTIDEIIKCLEKKKNDVIKKEKNFKREKRL